MADSIKTVEDLIYEELQKLNKKVTTLMNEHQSLCIKFAEFKAEMKVKVGIYIASSGILGGILGSIGIYIARNL